MMNLSLTSLSPQTFERLIRAICFERFGPAGVVYSSGSDGARDFTYDGDIEGYPWSGYLVVQAKFKETLQSPSQDLAWLRKQLNAEKKKYTEKAAKKPIYYIVATNVRLSGADGKTAKNQETKGGLTKVNEALTTWSSDVGIKGFDVWPADKIVDLLQSHEKIRRAFSAWLTPGDVLNDLISHIETKREDFQDSIRRAMRHCVRRDQYARLRDAGDVADPQIRASQVFLDLPLKAKFPEFQSTEINRVVSQLLVRCREKLDSETLISGRDKNDKDDVRYRRNRIVLLGGPGQGKSTASMFAVQIMRSNMMIDWPAILADRQTLHLCTEIRERAKQQKILLESARRFPVSVSLPRFADAISTARENGTPIPSVLAQIANDISSEGDQPIDKQDLRALLRKYPWFVVFDGLDEVPPSGERAAIIEAIGDFEGEIISGNSDILLVVTTRPQGYNDDLSHESWEHWELADLSTEDATNYGEALGAARYPDDPNRQKDLLGALKAATIKPAISRLMASPLQVTIMHMIVDTGGSIPSARWTLFSEYFDILRKREKAKGGENQKILERNWAILGPIHQRAGLVLQTDSERAGAAESYLSRDRFVSLVRTYLLEEGYESPEVDTRSEELVEVALHRLVLLAARDEGKIRFDVRSFQEFMAAGALTAGPDALVAKRLTHIARSAHWRHVLLFAASRCFSDDVLHHFRATVISIPREMETEPIELLAHTGARLALDLFIDGIGIDHPKSRRVLASHGLEILMDGSSGFDRRLLLLSEPTTHEIIKVTLKKQLLNIGYPAARATWAFLFALAVRDESAYSSILQSLILESGDIFGMLLEELPLPVPNGVTLDLVTQVLVSINPIAAGESLANFATRLKEFLAPETSAGISDETRSKYRAISVLLEPLRLERHGGDLAITINGEPTGLRFVQRSLRNPYEGWLANLASLPALGINWAPIGWAARFSGNSTARTLSASLKEMSLTFGLEVAKKIAQLLPWPLSAFVSCVDDVEKVEQIASAIDAGDYGDSGDWSDAIQRWATMGVTEADLTSNSATLPFAAEIASVGAPIFGTSLRISVESQDKNQLVQNLMNITHQLPEGKVRERAVQMTAFSTVGFRELLIEPSKALETMLRTLDLLSDAPIYPHVIASLDEGVWAREELHDMLDRLCARIDGYLDKPGKIKIQAIADVFVKKPMLRGLLVAIGVFLWSPSQESTKLEGLSESLLSPLADDSDAVLGALLAIRLKFHYSYSTVLAEIKRRATPNSLAMMIATKIFQGDGFRRAAIDCSPVLLEQAKRPFTPTESAIYTLLIKALDARLSGLIEHQTWCVELGFSEGAFSVTQNAPRFVGAQTSN